MKVRCPICNCVGLLQQRGHSYRIQHYDGFSDGRRNYVYHRIDSAAIDMMEVNGSKNLEVNSLRTDLFSRNKWTGGDLNPRPLECKSSVHAS